MNWYYHFFGSILFLCVSTVHADIERVSVSSTGQQANSSSQTNAISADGRFVAFSSFATNLVPADTNNRSDIFVRDLETGTIELISVSSSGEQGNAASLFLPSISADGRFVAFESDASNLVSGDTNSSKDIFIRDRETGITSIISLSSTLQQGNASSFSPVISADGRYIVFISDASNLVTNDSNSISDVFFHDLQTGVTELVSQSSTNEQANGKSYQPSLNADGRYVVFESDASNLINSDSNGIRDIFMRDRETGTTSLISLSTAGTQANQHSFHSNISADGRYVGFSSHASNLVAGDRNGTFQDVFIHDRVLGTTELVSLSSKGEQGDSSYEPSISADGRFVTFYSSSTNFTTEDSNDDLDVFIHDRQTGETKRISENNKGDQGNRNSYRSGISSQGSHIVFNSDASNLVAGDTNQIRDVFLVENTLAMSNDLSVKLRATSGAVAVDEYIRFRAIMTNTGSQTLTNCKAKIINPYVKSIFKRRFSFFTWPLGVTNPVINQRLDIAPGQTAKMNLAVLARDTYRGEVEFDFSCDNTRALPIPFVNSVHLVAKTTPIIAEDYIQMDTNGRSEVVIDQSNLFKYWYEYVVRVTNTGNDATSVNLNADGALIDRHLIRQLQFCERSDPSNPAVCAAPRSEQLQVDLAVGETKKVGVFIHAFEMIANKPVSNRVYVQAHDGAGEVVSATSIQVYTIN